MKFSIVTPLYNKALYIAETVDSVLAQTYTDFEFLIINDSSTDDSAEIVGSYTDSRIRLYTKPNEGVSAARNFGILNATGDYICFLDADDLWRPNYLQELYNTIKKFPNASFYCCAWDIFIESTSNIIECRNIKNGSSCKYLFLDYSQASSKAFGSIAITSAVTIKRSLLNEMTYLFDERYCIGEDNDMWLRCSLLTKVVYNNTPLMLYRSFAPGGLTQSKSIRKNIVDYTNWYQLSNNKYVWKFASQMLYTTARKFFNEHNYDDTISFLKLIKGYDLFWRKTILIAKATLLKKLFN